MAQRGFTLLEMLVVIVLIGVAAGLLGLGVRQGLQVAQERRVVGQMVEALRATRRGRSSAARRRAPNSTCNV